MTKHLPRILLCLALVGILAVGIYFLFATEHGARLRHEPTSFRTDARAFAAAHPVAAPAAVVGLYLATGLAMLPNWWIPVLAGAALGLTRGVIVCEFAATLSAFATFHASRYLASDFFHKRIESKMSKLRSLDEKLSHNGFLVVMVARLIHVLPFGASYYMFGLTTMTGADAAVGTALGYLPTSLLLVKTGVGWHTGHTARFVATLIAIQGILLLPIILRYLVPTWFKKVGLE